MRNVIGLLALATFAVAASAADDPSIKGDKRAAIQARQRLYKAGVQEYRAERREADRQRRRAAERDEGVER